jgi:hypothetical protein
MAATLVLPNRQPIIVGFLSEGCKAKLQNRVPRQNLIRSESGAILSLRDSVKSLNPCLHHPRRSLPMPLLLPSYFVCLFDSANKSQRIFATDICMLISYCYRLLSALLSFIVTLIAFRRSDYCSKRLA